MLAVLALLPILGVGAHTQSHDAKPPPDAWSARTLSVEAHAGVGNPVGGLGIAAEWTPYRWLGLSAGLGGFIRDGGPRHQLATMVRLRHVGEAGWAASGGLGVSGGQWIGYDSELSTLLTAHGTRFEGERIGWLNGELSIDKRYLNGVQFRMYAGVTTMLNPGGLTCSARNDFCEPPPTSKTLPYLGGAFGYSF